MRDNCSLSLSPRSLLGLAGSAFAAESNRTRRRMPPRQKWSFAGPFGKFDRGQLQRGFKVYQEVCAVCHGLKYVAFRNLDGARAIPTAQVAAIAAEYKIQDGPNDQGEMFERAGRPADYFPSPFPNENAARARYNGVPPDMSVLAKARSYERGFPWFIFDIFTQFQEQGVDYIDALLTGYGEAAGGRHAAAGHVLQQVFPRPCDRHAAAADRRAGRLHRRLADDGRSVRQGRHGVPDVGGRAAPGGAQAHRLPGDDLPDRARRACSTSPRRRCGRRRALRTKSGSTSLDGGPIA